MIDVATPDEETNVSGLGFGDFETLIDAEDAAAVLTDIELEMKETGFGDVEVRDFTDFNRTGEFIEEGTHVFAVEARFLAHAASVMKLVGTVGAKSDNTVKITIFQDRVKLASFNKVAFAENLLKLTRLANVEKDHEVAFVFDANILERIARHFAQGGVIEFTYNAAKKELVVKEGSTVLALTTRPHVDFSEFHKQIGAPEYVGAFDPTVMHNSLTYISLFSKRDDTQRNMGVINIDGGQPTKKHGRVSGGSYTGIAIYDAPGLSNIKLRIPNPAIRPIAKIITKMHPEHTHMFRAGNFVIFRDQNLYLGFELTEYEFPPINQVLEEALTDTISITRAHLMSSLQKLAVVNSNIDTTVAVSITGTGNNALIMLKVADQTGRISSDQLSVTRDIKYKSDHSFELPLVTLARTIDHFKTENVILQPTGISMLIRDEGAEYDATTVLTLMTPEVKQTIEQQRAAQKKKETSATTGVTDDDIKELGEDDTEDALLESVG